MTNQAMTASGQSNAGNNKIKILIIEDDQSLARILERALDPDKFKAVLALEADEGLEKAILEKPEIIVLDILLPGKSGFECLKNLKADTRTKAIPVIILSNLGQTEEIRAGLKLGAVDYLVKADFTIDEVIEKIIDAVKKK